MPINTIDAAHAAAERIHQQELLAEKTVKARAVVEYVRQAYPATVRDALAGDHEALFDLLIVTARGGR